MSTYGDKFATLVPKIMSFFGDTTTLKYTPISTGTQATITAVVDPPMSDGGALGVDGVDRANRRFLVRASDVSIPEGDDEIDDGDSRGIWFVNQDGIKKRPGGTWLLTCSRAHPYAPSAS